MPPELASIITEHAAIKTARPPPPTLEPRPLQFESRRSGVIAIKAGMMQDWDEYGARVPLTVLWIDECMVSEVFSFLLLGLLGGRPPAGWPNTHAQSGKPNCRAHGAEYYQ
jgi:hypothetical protein